MVTWVVVGVAYHQCGWGGGREEGRGDGGRGEGGREGGRKEGVEAEAKESFFANPVKVAFFSSSNQPLDSLTSLLSLQLLSVQEAMRLGEAPTGACPKESKAVVDQLTGTHPAGEEEIKALLISAEAFKGQTSAEV